MLDRLDKDFEIEKEAYEITSLEEALLTFEQIFDEQSKVKNLQDKIKRTKEFTKIKSSMNNLKLRILKMPYLLIMNAKNK